MGLIQALLFDGDPEREGGALPFLGHSVRDIIVLMERLFGPHAFKERGGVFP